MQIEFMFLSPVQVVKVTKDNMEEVAEWCGGRVAQAESRKVKGRMDSYVWVPTPENSHISWAFPGMYITKRLVKTIKGDLKETWAVFRRDYFEKNYFKTMNAAVDETWELQAKGAKVINFPKPAEKVINVSNDVADQIEEVKAAVEKIAEAAGINLEDRTSDQVTVKTEELFSKPESTPAGMRFAKMPRPTSPAEEEEILAEVDKRTKVAPAEIIEARQVAALERGMPTSEVAKIGQEEFIPTVNEDADKFITG